MLTSTYVKRVVSKSMLNILIKGSFLGTKIQHLELYSFVEIDSEQIHSLKTP